MARTRLPAIPRARFGSADQQRQSDAMQTLAETLSGRRGSGLDRAVLVRDLADAGLVNLKSIGGNVSIGGGKPPIWDDTPGSSGEFNFPPEPVHLQVFGAFTAIALTWDNADYVRASTAAHTEIWRNDVDSLATAYKLATTISLIHSDPVGTGSNYFYWIRHVNVNEDGVSKKGSYSASVNGTTSNDVSNIIEDLAEQMVSSDLVTALLSDIDTTIADGDKLVSDALSEAETELKKADELLVGAVAKVSEEYKDADRDLAASIKEVNIAAITDDAVLAQTIKQLNAAYNSVSVSEVASTNAKITETQKVAATATEAVALRATSLEATVNGTEDNPGIMAQVVELDKVNATATEAVAITVAGQTAIWQEDDKKAAITTQAAAALDATGKANAAEAAAALDATGKADQALKDARADITTVAETAANDTSAAVTRVETMETEIYGKEGVGGLKAQLKTTENLLSSVNTDGSVAHQALWSKVATAGEITAGIGLLAKSDGTSEVAVSASKFLVFDPNNTRNLTPLFAVSKGKVVIPKALIEEATIQILDAEVITADKIVASASITSPIIKGGTLDIGRFHVETDGSFWAGTSEWNAGIKYTASTNSLKVRGDIQATSLQADTLMLRKKHVYANEFSGITDSTIQKSKISGWVYVDAQSKTLFMMRFLNNTSWRTKFWLKIEEYPSWRVLFEGAEGEAERGEHDRTQSITYRHATNKTGGFWIYYTAWMSGMGGAHENMDWTTNNYATVATVTMHR